jgi:hypothetical protein
MPASLALAGFFLFPVACLRKHAEHSGDALGVIIGNAVTNRNLARFPAPVRGSEKAGILPKGTPSGVNRRGEK